MKPEGKFPQNLNTSVPACFASELEVPFASDGLFIYLFSSSSSSWKPCSNYIEVSYLTWGCFMLTWQLLRDALQSADNFTQDCHCSPVFYQIGNENFAKLLSENDGFVIFKSWWSSLIWKEKHENQLSY